MARIPINLGTTPNDGTGTPLRTAGADLNAMFIELYAGGGIPLGVVLKDGSGVNAATFLDRALLDETGSAILAWDSSGILIPQEVGISNPNWGIDGVGNATNLNLAACTGYDISAGGPNNNTDGSGLNLSTFNSEIGSGGDGISDLYCAGGAFHVDNSGRIYALTLPTSDPGNNGQFYSLAGVVHVSAG